MNTNEYYFFYDSTGQIVEAGTCNTISLKTKVRAECTLVTGIKASFKDGYLEGKVYTPPSSPSTSHVFNYKIQQWELDTPHLLNQLYERRNQLLLDSDWTQLPDVPEITRKLWIDYRQALRDITNQVGFPVSVTWPIKPS